MTDNNRNHEESTLENIGKFGVGLLGAHVASNAVIHHGLKTELGKKLFKENILNPKKPMGPFKQGLVTALLGPEMTELHLNVLRSKNRRAYNQVAVKGFKNIAKNTAGVLTAGLLSPIPGVGHLINYNLVKDIGKTFLRLKPTEKKYLAAKMFLKGVEKPNSLGIKLSPYLKSPLVGKLNEYGAAVGKHLPSTVRKGVGAASRSMDSIVFGNSTKGKIMQKLIRFIT